MREIASALLFAALPSYFRCCSLKAALLESVDRAAVLSRFHSFPSENSIASAGGASILLQPQGRLVAEERQVIVGGNGCFIGE